MMRRAKPLPEELEKGLGGLGRLRILWFLSQQPTEAFTRYQLGKVLPLHPRDLTRDLNALVQLGWVNEAKYKQKKYRLNLENEHTRYLNEFFQRLRGLELP